MAYDEKVIKKLEEKARILRRDAVEMIRAGESGWVGVILGCGACFLSFGAGKP